MGTMTARDTLTDAECDAIWRKAADTIPHDRRAAIDAAIRAAYAAGAAAVPREPTRAIYTDAERYRLLRIALGNAVALDGSVDEWAEQARKMFKKSIGLRSGTV